MKTAALTLAAAVVGFGAAFIASTAIAEDAPPSRVCGLAWGERGYFDGAAGRPLQPHPYGSEEDAVAACKRAGLAAPRFNAYIAQHGAGAFLRAQNANAGGKPLRPRGRTGPRRNAAFPSDALAAAGAEPYRCRPSETRRAGAVGAPAPIACDDAGLSPSERRALHRQGRRDRATEDAVRRLDAQRIRLQTERTLPRNSPAQRRFIDRDRRTAERERRAVEIFRRVRPQLP